MAEPRSDTSSSDPAAANRIDIIPVVKSHTISEFLPVIPNFDGNSSFSRFFDKFNSIAEYCNWDANDKILALSLRLTGEAQEFINTQRNLKQAKDFDLIVNSLRDRFETKSNMASNITKLTQAYQLPCENARQFFSRLEGISYNCVPNNNSTEFEDYRQQLLLSAAKQGLRVELLRGIASTALNSYNEFKKHALTFEENFKVIEPLELAATIQAKAGEKSDNKIDSLTDKIEQLTVKLNDMQIQLNAQSIHSNKENSHRTRNVNNHLQAQSKKKCFRCNKLGHIAKYCRIPFCNFCNRSGHSLDNCFKKNKSLN